jgi:hypothetical protein
MNPDVRAGLPSASKLARVIQCPGSESLIRVLPPDALQTADADDKETAARGTAIHRARELLSDEGLADPEDRDLYNKGLEYERILLKRWMADKGLTQDQVTEGPRENRFWLNDPETMEPLASGQLDVFYMAPPYAFVLDWKALWAWHIPPTPRSAQLRLQAVVLWADRTDITEIRVAYIKPMVPKGGTDDTCDYTVPDLRFALQHIRYQLWLAQQPDSCRYPGSECRYCPAKAYCREGAAWSLLPSVQKERQYTIIAPDPIALVQTLSPEDLLKLWAMAPLVGKGLDAVKDRLKSFSDEALAKLGLERGLGRALDPIVDVAGWIQAVKAAGWSDDQIARCLRVAKEDVAEVISEREGIAPKYASKRVSEDFDRFIERKRAEPSIRAIKGLPQ